MSYVRGAGVQRRHVSRLCLGLGPTQVGPYRREEGAYLVESQKQTRKSTVISGRSDGEQA